MFNISVVDDPYNSANDLPFFNGQQEFGVTMFKGWICFNGTGTIATISSYNVSSIRDDGTGIYAVLWDTDFADTSYSTIAMAEEVLSAARIASTDVGSESVGAIGISVRELDQDRQDSAKVSVLAAGTQ